MWRPPSAPARHEMARSSELAERKFRDTTGAEWRVLEVRPTYRDRRQQDRRLGAASDPVIERRRGPDRRVRPGGRSLLNETFKAGWLCFMSTVDEDERRRVAPIPADWQSFSDHQLSAFVDRPPLGDAPPRHD